MDRGPTYTGGLPRTRPPSLAGICHAFASLRSTSQTLRSHFANTSRTLRKHFANTSQTLRKHFANTSRLRKHFANTSRLRIASQHFAVTSQTLRKHFANTSQTLREHFANTSRRFALASHPSQLLCRKRRRDIYLPGWGVFAACVGYWWLGWLGGGGV